MFSYNNGYLTYSLESLCNVNYIYPLKIKEKRWIGKFGTKGKKKKKNLKSVIRNLQQILMVQLCLSIKIGEKMTWERSKCVFPKMGTKRHQLKKGEKRVDPEKTKQIAKDRKKRLQEWNNWLKG